MTDSPSNPSPDQPRQLVLVKDAQRWVFRYVPGEETALLGSLVDAARDPSQDFSFFDAAVLSHQMAGHLQQKLRDLMSQ